MQDARIQVLIPTYNSADDIVQTLDSVWRQNYEKENIYVTVVDFGSTDETLARLYAYDSFHLGIYQKTEQKNARLRVAEAARLLDYVRPGGLYSFYVLLYPGDILYPECLYRCAKAFVENYDTNPIMVICEADILLPDGTLIKQRPLYPEDRVIDGTVEINDYIKHEYKHQIFEMVLFFGNKKYKANGEINEQRFWNKAARFNLERNAVYLNEALICTKAVVYKDEFEEILFRWEAIISTTRFYTSAIGHGFSDDFEMLAKQNLSYYALWRSWLLYQRSGCQKETENCFLIAGVIDSKVEDTEIYGWLKKLIFEKDKTVLPQVNKYFAWE